MAIRVLICDDHGLVRSGLRMLLDGEADIEVVEQAGSGVEAVRKARMEKPDLVLLDVAMPGISGLEAIPKIRAAAPEAKFLVLSMHDDAAYVREAFASGATGYLLKDAADTDLVAAVREVAAGGRYLHAALGARLAAGESAPAPDPSPLSDREREVLRLLASGYTNHEIAQMLYVSVRTAETHRAHIMQKLRLTTRAQLVNYALHHELLDNTPNDDPKR
jgi:two-component system, NarL family, response regulator NreC